MTHVDHTHHTPVPSWTRAARASRRERGISLIEVLVAIALLTIGILSVITLFPAGFLTLEIAANATNADRIGQRELEKLNATNTGQMGIIQSIYSNYDAAGPTGTSPNLVPVLTPAGVSPTTPVALGQNNDINAYRLVKGETVRVPTPITFTPTGGTLTTLSLYTPAFAPIVSPSNAGVAGQPPSVFAVHGLPWSRRAQNSGGLTNDPTYGDPATQLGTNQPQYLIDYTNGKITLPQAAYSQTVLFQFTDGTTPSAITYHVTITVPATLSGQWIDPFSSAFSGTTGASTTALPSSAPLPTTGEPILPWKTGADVLSRDFVNVTSTTTGYGAGNFTADPYQFQLYNAFGTANGSGDITAASPIANLGVIAFNPVGAAIKDTNGRPLMASIDYEVYDWHIISEDRTASTPTGSTSTNSALRLSLRSLYSKTARDTYSDDTRYTGLFYNTPPLAVANNLDVTVLDLQKGIVLTQSTSAAANDYNVNYPDGVITVTTAAYFNEPLRIFYRAREDWGVALSKAPANYVLTDYTATSATPNYGECQLDAANQKMYFPLADLGKTVHIAALIGMVGTGALPNIDLVLQTITKDPNANRGLIDLTKANSLGNGSPFPTGTTLNTVANGQTGTVQGATVQAQVIWKEQGIWKHREITSIIPTGTTQMAVQQ